MTLNVTGTNLAAMSAAGSGEGAEGGYLKAVVSHGPDRDGGFLLRLDDGRQMIVTVDKDIKIPPGTKVMVSPSDGKMFIPMPDTAQAQNTQNAKTLDTLTGAAGAENTAGAAAGTAARHGVTIDVAITAEKIHASFESALLKSLPVSSLEKIAAERGGLDLETLKSLDAALRGRGISIDPSSQTQVARLEQWLRVVLDNPKLIEDLAERAPVLGAREIAEKFQLLERVGLTLLSSNILKGLSPEQFFLSGGAGTETNAAGRGAPLEALLSKAFSAAPEKMLELIKLIEALKSGTGDRQHAAPGLTAESAKRVIGEILSSLPNQILGKQEQLHDVRMLSPKMVTDGQKPSVQIFPSSINNSQAASASIKSLLGDGGYQQATKSSPLYGDREYTQATKSSPLYGDREYTQVTKSSPLYGDRGYIGVNNVSPERTSPPKTDYPNTHTLKPLPEQNFPSGKISTLTSTAGEYRPAQHVAPRSINNSQAVSARENYPLPQSLFDRAVSEPKFQINTANRNAVFSQIDSTLSSIRKVIDGGGAARRTNASDPVVSNTPQQPTHTNINKSNPPSAPSTPGTPSNTSANMSGVPANTSSVQTQTARSILTQTEKILTGFQNAFSSLDVQSKIAPADVSGGSAGDIIKQSLDSLRVETLLNVSRALQMVFSSIEELGALIERMSDGSRTLTDAEGAMLRASEALMRQARLSGAAASETLNDILRELTRMQTEAMRAEGHHGAARTPAEIMRSAALSAAGGLESLHLLASQTRGTENSQQQMFALPVKMGDEWTEVQVKFIKSRKKSQGADGKAADGRVSVYLNVAPSALGRVSAHLDFHPPANLKLAFEFERPEVTKWFKEQSAALRETLAEAGLPGTALTFYTMRKTAGHPDINRDKDTALMKDAANTGGHIGKDGKVDFRI